MLTISLEEGKAKVRESREKLGPSTPVSGDSEIESILGDDRAELPEVEESDRQALAVGRSMQWLRQLEWTNDPVPLKWDKIRAVFLNAYTPEEIFYQAQGMRFREWLDFAVKMMQRQVEMPPMQITTIRVELPDGASATVEASKAPGLAPGLAGGAEVVYPEFEPLD